MLAIAVVVPVADVPGRGAIFVPLAKQVAQFPARGRDRLLAQLVVGRRRVRPGEPTDQQTERQNGDPQAVHDAPPAYTSGDGGILSGARSARKGHFLTDANLARKRSLYTHDRRGRA